MLGDVVKGTGVGTELGETVFGFVGVGVTGASFAIGEELGVRKIVGLSVKSGFIHSQIQIDGGMLSVNKVGGSLGNSLGTPDGTTLGGPDGTLLGSKLGISDGGPLGIELGIPLGTRLGGPLGTLLGTSLGTPDGGALGTPLGFPLGGWLVLGGSVGGVLG